MVDSDSESNSGEKGQSKDQLTAEESEQLLDADGKRPPLLLRLTADMFRQHSDLFLQQAAVLERVATNPIDPSSWKIKEEAPESVQKRLVRENVAALAIKSYESMLLVQKRVDYLETVMHRNGVRPFRRTVKDAPKKVNLPTAAKNAFYWFRQEQGPRIAEELGIKDINVSTVKKRLVPIWEAMNPNQRLPYAKKAKAAVPNFFPKRLQSPKIAASKVAKKSDSKSEEGGDEGPPGGERASRKGTKASSKRAKEPDGDSVSEEGGETTDLQRKKRALTKVATAAVKQQDSNWEIENNIPEETDSDHLDCLVVQL